MIPTPIRFDDQALHLLDQRRLPAQEVWIDCHGAADAAEAIADLVVRGAPAIGITAAYGLALEGRRTDLDQLEVAARGLIAARPTAVNLGWAVERMMQCARSIAADGDELGAALTREALAIHREDAEACRAIGRYGLTLLSDSPRVLTHCNAGALATGGIGTALAPIYTAMEEGRNPEVFACEARPVMQGSRLTTWELTRAGVPVTLLVDSAAAFLIRRGEVESIWVGADRIAANGDVANKVGTLSLACAAALADVPFYVAAPRSTFDPDTPNGAAIPIEYRDPSELAARFAEPVSARETRFWTPAFDITPVALVTAYVSEEGISSGGRSKRA